MKQIVALGNVDFRFPGKKIQHIEGVGSKRAGMLIKKIISAVDAVDVGAHCSGHNFLHLFEVNSVITCEVINTQICVKKHMPLAVVSIVGRE